MVVFFEGRDAIGFDRMKPKGIWQCRHGVFHHDEMVGKPFGSRVRTDGPWDPVVSRMPGVTATVCPRRVVASCLAP